MFDIGFSELLLIGVVALVVLGPERLPKVARTAGHLIGRLQRYMAAVKADMEREGHLQDLHALRDQFEASKREVEQSVQQAVNTAQAEVTEQAQTIHAPLDEARQEVEAAVAPASAAQPQPDAEAAVPELAAAHPNLADKAPSTSEKTTG